MTRSRVVVLGAGARSAAIATALRARDDIEIVDVPGAEPRSVFDATCTGIVSGLDIAPPANRHERRKARSLARRRR